MEEKSKEFYGYELAEIERCTDEEMKELFPKAAAGEKAAIDRLVEGNMYRVILAADYFETDTCPFMDLVQEGNLALFMMVINESEFKDDTEIKMMNAIQDAMLRFKESEEEAFKAGEELKVKLNVIDEVCRRLKEELEREPTADEVAEMMKMDVSDVRYLLQIALAAVKKEN